MRAVNPIASLLKRSPFKPMQEHMRTVIGCVSEVPGLFEALISGNQEELTAHQERIFAKEHEADNLKNDLRAHLPRSLFMPVDRRDLLEMLELQDAIANIAQDIAGLTMERNMSVPENMAEPLMALVQRCVETCNDSAAIINELDELVETGFRGREVKKVELMVARLNQSEHETDELGSALTRILFSQEDEMRPVSVMFWYQLIKWIGNLADNAEQVGDRLRLLIAR